MRPLKILALALAAALLLSGCSGFLNYLDGGFGLKEIVAYKDMEYKRPDMAQLEASLDRAIAAAEAGTSVQGTMQAVYDFYEHYDGFLTNMSLADIRYSADLTDSYWEAEYGFCTENSPRVDAALEELYTALAASKLRGNLEADYFGQDFFLDYEGESYWDDTFLSLLEQEAELEGRYYALADQALAEEPYSDAYYEKYGTQMAQLYVELIALRQQIAGYLGYDSYPEFMYEASFYRDYTPAQAEAYMEAIGRILTDLYRDTVRSDIWDYSYRPCDEAQTFAYVKNAANAMGGSIQAAFNLLEKAGLYDISYGENKYDSSFEVYLWSYGEPFIFMCPYMDQSDKLTFAHEFGHFANDYVCGGSYVGSDVAEVHSQAFEYLSLCYSQGVEQLTAYKMADSLSTYVETAAYALFEHRVYGLTGEDLTVENVEALYEQICLQFGFDSWGWDSRDYVTVPHFFTDPMYMISYVVSNDLAMQFYQLEQEEAGKGLKLYEQCLRSEDSYIIAFAEAYGLESPFVQGRLEAVARTFEEVLK